MNQDILFKELVTFYHTNAALNGAHGTDEDLARAENRFWVETGRWFDNWSYCTDLKGNALDGFCAHRSADYATRQLQGDTVEILWCGDCQREIGEIGYDFPRQTNNRHETPELVEMEF